jgi:8-amino-7-oxononanoate synthase
MMSKRDAPTPIPQHSFSGTAYLGIPHLPEFRSHLLEGIIQWGTHYGGSRLSNTAPAIYAEAESSLAGMVGAASALLFSSGTLAGQVLIKVLSREAGLYLAPGVHPALWQDKGPETNHFDQWAASMAVLCATPGPPIALLANSVDPLGVRAFDFSFLSNIPIRRQVILVVDDSHGFFLLGKNGEGAYPTIAALPGIEPLVISSLGKAAGIPAGIIFGSEDWIARLKNTPFFGGASPTPPAYIHALLKAGAVYDGQRTRLKALLQYFTGHLPPSPDLHFMPDFPVFRIEEPAKAQALQAAGIEISSFSYPTPSDPPVSRIVINAGHDEQALDTVLKVLCIS